MLSILAFSILLLLANMFVVVHSQMVVATETRTMTGDAMKQERNLEMWGLKYNPAWWLPYLEE